MLVHFGNKPAFIKSAKARSYVTAFKMQCPKLSTPLEIDVSVHINIYYASRRPDLDESVILDAMQGLVINNDRQVKEKHIFWGLDRLRPRAEITLYPLGQSHPVPGRPRTR